MQQVISGLQQDFEVTTQPRPECSFVCQSLHNLRTTYVCVHVAFYFKFGFVWEGHGLVSVSLFVLGVGEV